MDKTADRAIEELEKISALLQDIARPGYSEISKKQLESLAEFLHAETAGFRTLGVRGNHLVRIKVVGVGIPNSVSDAYVARYHRWDPVRRLLLRRITQPMLSHPQREGEWLNEKISPHLIDGYKREFQKYQKEFLFPNNLYHHLGFCLEGADGKKFFYDFHRGAHAPPFGELEQARARVIAWYLYEHEKNISLPPPSDRRLESCLSSREREVALAVARGLSNKEAAYDLNISVRTVENHLRAIFSKLNVSTRSRLIAEIYRHT